MTAAAVLAELEKLGNAPTKKTWMRHGATEPCFGVKIGDMKPIQKRIKSDHELALALYDTGNADAMYFAALIAEPMKMTKAQLNKWAKAATWQMISEYAVAWTASESRFATELALEWMASKKEGIAASGWATYSSYVAITPDENLDLDEIVGLLDRVPTAIAAAPNRVKYTMNNFVISVGCYVSPLLAKAKAVAKKLGKVEVDVGDTDCKVPLATESIAKVEAMERVGKKRKEAKC